MPNASEVVDAWYGETGKWSVHPNTAGRWEVIHDIHGEDVCNARVDVVGRFGTAEEAMRYAVDCENHARAINVIALFWREERSK